jgi:polyferredoxin
MNRKLVQALFAFTSNAHVQGFITGRLYKGELKNVCVPGLNCYSCPGALGACPIGAMQAVEGSVKYGISMYVTGFVVFVGILLGRFVCGWLCPFGLIQELLHKIPLRKLKVPRGVDRPLRWLKYAVLLLAVIILPIVFASKFGLATPFFCKYICPAGTLEGGVPLLLANTSLRSAIGFLFSWKMGILLLVLVLSVLIYRPFCRYLCPLGALYSLFNPISFYRYKVDGEKCTLCGACERVCKMEVVPHRSPNSPECIRCGACKRACPQRALTSTWSKTKP